MWDIWKGKMKRTGRGGFHGIRTTVTEKTILGEKN